MHAVLVSLATSDKLGDAGSKSRIGTSVPLGEWQNEGLQPLKFRALQGG